MNYAFAERLRNLRLELNLTQDQVAEGVRYCRKTVIDWEMGKKLPAFDAIISLCKYFGVSADWLLGLQ